MNHNDTPPDIDTNNLMRMAQADSEVTWTDPWQMHLTKDMAIAAFKRMYQEWARSGTEAGYLVSDLKEAHQMLGQMIDRIVVEKESVR